MIGKIFNNRYKIIEKLGSGGTSIVYRGQDLLLNRMVTVKILREEYASNADFVRRFRHEAQAVASLSHSNIVAVYDVGFEENMHYIVMEFVEGESLKDYIRRKGALPVPEACNIITQILAGVQHAHEHGIIHRDLKSHNILLSKDGRAKVTDFGIAVGMSDVTLTYNTSSRIMGSVHYISPEQVQGQAVTEKSDIYSVGVIFYEMLTGRLPFLGETPISIAMQHVQGELILPHQINPKVPMGISYVVMRAMRKNPDARYDNAENMAKAVRAAYSGESVVPEEPAAVFDDDDELKKIITTKRPQNKDKKGGLFADGKLNTTRMVFLIVGAVLLVALIVVAVKFLGLFGQSGPAVMPQVVGLSLSDAEAKLAENDLVADITYMDSTEDANTVIGQDIAEGEEVERGSSVGITVSNGISGPEMPNLMGATRKIAELTLANKGITPKITEQYDEEAPLNEVIYQYPEEGAIITSDTVVELVISLGPEPEDIFMPTLLGKTLEEARPIIEEYKLNVIETKYEPSTEYNKGQICAQSIQPNASTQTGVEITITVSEGPGPQAKTHTAYYMVPNDGEEHQVIVEVVDSQGSREVYNEDHEPGTFVDYTFEYYGTGSMNILLDGIVVDN
ncbi:MAG: Stk1 family PASTA domain-containing Ser/Thr kinase, partial [Firmicutes bacterium]|nr:Stk1 family PASTA domain-containing Ser/Thr kinase [Bacillota bacterium]